MHKWREVCSMEANKSIFNWSLEPHQRFLDNLTICILLKHSLRNVCVIRSHTLHGNTTVCPVSTLWSSGSLENVWTADVTAAASESQLTTASHRHSICNTEQSPVTSQLVSWPPPVTDTPTQNSHQWRHIHSFIHCTASQLTTASHRHSIRNTEQSPVTSQLASWPPPATDTPSATQNSHQWRQIHN